MSQLIPFEMEMCLDIDHVYRQTLLNGERYNPNDIIDKLDLIAHGSGLRYRVFAVVPVQDQNTIQLVSGRGFEVIPVNGNRKAEVSRLQQELLNDVNGKQTRRLVVVTGDGSFASLCQAAQMQDISLSAWVTEGGSLADFDISGADIRSLTDVLNRDTMTDVRIDYENIYFRLKDAGLPTSPVDIIDAIYASLGLNPHKTKIKAYGDFSMLNGITGLDVQRELALLGVETCYQLGIKGKSSSDMKMIDDTLNFHNSPLASQVRRVVLATGDGDFRSAVEALHILGKDVSVLAVRSSLNKFLSELADDVTYLDDYFNQEKDGKDCAKKEFPMIALTLAAVREMSMHGWQWIKRENLLNVLDMGTEGEQLIRRALKERILVTGPHAGSFMLVSNNPLVRLAQELLNWLPKYINYLRNVRGFRTIDNGILAREMIRNQALWDLGIQSEKVAEVWLRFAKCFDLLPS